MSIRNLLASWMSVMLLLSCAGVAQQKESVPRPVDKHTLASDNVKVLLLLMDTDKNGKITKQEWMRFMEAEFDRLDTNKNGELDPKELLQSRVSAKPLRSEDVGK